MTNILFQGPGVSREAEVLVVEQTIGRLRLPWLPKKNVFIQIKKPEKIVMAICFRLEIMSFYKQLCPLHFARLSNDLHNFGFYGALKSS